MCGCVVSSMCACFHFILHVGVFHYLVSKVTGFHFVSTCTAFPILSALVYVRMLEGPQPIRRARQVI